MNDLLLGILIGVGGSILILFLSGFTHMNDPKVFSEAEVNEMIQKVRKQYENNSR
ncbi:hypothetical protein G7059_08000 [Erysipelothrix sp. HDW6A]|uniref:hypothetical protein n=1 Tax=Erysipelothrix sp. HDW6A TaxID=2714928 RepID=UPI00140740D0|nr:hypothetical protein [Erysipelothrix sp. HDW6A]QIK57784.1 hypothetical protein G7059_08000 [Erysipelothrix sp. HDW6A]